MEKSVVVNGMKAPESVSKIGKAFINEFMAKATPEQQAWVILTLEREVRIHGNKKGFFSFRSEFANMFFPEIIAKNKVKEEKKSFLDELKKKYA